MDEMAHNDLIVANVTADGIVTIGGSKVLFPRATAVTVSYSEELAMLTLAAAPSGVSGVRLYRLHRPPCVRLRLGRIFRHLVLPQRVRLAMAGDYKALCVDDEHVLINFGAVE
ncbi:MAG: hypothetical protein KGL39_37605 [Patescibacteria group bacterium]|nr:hypothetical protein [Patescibacteria group bacterium]